MLGHYFHEFGAQGVHAIPKLLMSLHASSAQDWAAANPVPSIKEGPDSKIQSFQGFTLCLLLSSDSYKIQFGKAMP